MDGCDIIVECAGKEACIHVKNSMNAGRRIILKENDRNTRGNVLNKLKMLTNDTLNVRLIGNDFTVEIVKFEKENKISKKSGTELIRNLIRPGHCLKTVTIKVVNGRNYAYPVDYDWEKAQNPEEGTDAIIDINIMEEFVVPTIDSNGNYKDEDFMLLHITLAHELIHAYHIVNGISKPNKVDYHYEYFDETRKRRLITEYEVDIEELYTIGIDNYENEDITENRIRKEREPEQNKRIGYGKYESRRIQ